MKEIFYLETTDYEYRVVMFDHAFMNKASAENTANALNAAKAENPNYDPIIDGEWVVSIMMVADEPEEFISQVEVKILWDRHNEQYMFDLGSCVKTKVVLAGTPLPETVIHGIYDARLYVDVASVFGRTYNEAAEKAQTVIDNFRSEGFEPPVIAPKGDSSVEGILN